MSEFKFEGLTIERIIAHSIFARGKDKQLIPPQTSDVVIPLDIESRDLVQIRITEALGSASHGIEVHIAKSEKTSFMQQAAEMIHMDEAAFIKQSKQLALDLAEAQTNPKWPAGVLMILSGKVGAQQKPYLAAIKAETDRGFNIEESNGGVSLKLIKKMLLSQTQRLYKIGMLIEINYQKPNPDGYAPANYRTFLFDHLLTSTETKSAAAYFYDAFLGMNIVGSSKHQTRTFYEETKNFINSLPVEVEEKYSLLEALRSELRSNNGTISVKAFASEHLPKEQAAAFISTMKDKGLPETAIVKDLDYIKSKLRRPRSVLFSTGVKIQVPAEKDLKELVEVAPQMDGYTSVRVKGVVEAQE